MAVVVFAQVPLALLLMCQRGTNSLTARVCALTALHAIRSEHEARVTVQLEGYSGVCVYERTVLALLHDCMPGPGHHCPDAGPFQSSQDDLLRCAARLLWLRNGVWVNTIAPRVVVLTRAYSTVVDSRV